jgi:epoxyqueuosine reductase
LNGQGLADELCGIGRRAGLDRVGICDARPFWRARRAIEDRQRTGLSAGMQFTYRNPARSTDPQASLPGARALVVGARFYHRRSPQSRPGEGPQGRVARYSWVDHYAPLRQALGVVADRLVADGWRARVLVDDNALVDRAAAVRAGLGWYGKNANVLIPDAGSLFVLGSVITDAPLAAAVRPTPVQDGCGSCRRCIVDCPTGALVSPGQLDARRCLAWLVQAPGVFPVEYRAALGDRLYGCDDCQERCPANRRGWPPEEPEEGAQATLSVLALLHATDDELEELVGRWYIPGREMRYIRRNALVVLANVADPADPAVEDVLEKALANPDGLVRAHAVWAARRLGLSQLLHAVAGDDDPLVVAELTRP